MKAVTTTVEGPSEPGSEKPQAIQNLFDLMNLVSDKASIAHFESSYYDGSIRFGDMKKQLAEDMVQFVSPISERINEAMNNPELVAKAAKRGTEKASESADKTIREVREIIGFKKFY